MPTRGTHALVRGRNHRHSVRLSVSVTCPRTAFVKQASEMLWRMAMDRRGEPGQTLRMGPSIWRGVQTERSKFFKKSTLRLEPPSPAELRNYVPLLVEQMERPRPTLSYFYLAFNGCLSSYRPVPSCYIPAVLRFLIFMDQCTLMLGLNNIIDTWGKVNEFKGYICGIT